MNINSLVRIFKNYIEIRKKKYQSNILCGDLYKEDSHLHTIMLYTSNTLALISIQVNLLAFCYIALERSLRSCRNKNRYRNGTNNNKNNNNNNDKSSTKSTTTTNTSCVLKVFPCEEIMNYRKCKHSDHTISRA